MPSAFIKLRLNSECVLVSFFFTGWKPKCFHLSDVLVSPHHSQPPPLFLYDESCTSGQSAKDDGHGPTVTVVLTSLSSALLRQKKRDAFHAVT